MLSLGKEPTNGEERNRCSDTYLSKDGMSSECITMAIPFSG